MAWTRRRLLQGLGATGTLLLGCPSLDEPPGTPPATGPFAGGTYLGLAPLGPEATRPLDSTYGEGLDGRRYVDLAELDADSLVLSNEDFYIRTREPDTLDPTGWSIQIDGLVSEELTLSLDDLEALSVDQGVHLMECSGNGGGGRFGLLSAARWGGVPIGDVLDLVAPQPSATRILIEGYDVHSAPSEFSTPGCSWVFTRDQLEEAGAFLALTMNDAPLPPDHGFPVRLLVPGWYGCCCAKWVQRITFVDDDEPATSQMQEFAQRTHQTEAHPLAADYAPADIQLAAMPLRVERWRTEDGALLHRIVGVLWGGTTITDALTIDWGEGPVPVDTYEHTQTRTWTLWEHAWAPPGPGEYTLAMGVADPSVPARRLDLGWYHRTVAIDLV